jgi:ribonuclease HI
MYTLFFDGCSKGNPGRGGAGAVLYENDIELESYSLYVGDRVTNNFAEYSGLILGLENANRLGIKTLHIKGDSLLVIRQMNGEYKVNSTLKEIYLKAKSLTHDTFTFSHVYRTENKRADQLSNEALINFN